MHADRMILPSSSQEYSQICLRVCRRWNKSLQKCDFGININFVTKLTEGQTFRPGHLPFAWDSCIWAIARANFCQPVLVGCCDCAIMEAWLTFHDVAIVQNVYPWPHNITRVQITAGHWPISDHFSKIANQNFSMVNSICTHGRSNSWRFGKMVQIFYFALCITDQNCEWAEVSVNDRIIILCWMWSHCRHVTCMAMVSLSNEGWMLHLLPHNENHWSQHQHL